MDSKDIWLDTSGANSEEPETVATTVIEYHATRVLPIEELNRREATPGMVEEEADAGKGGGERLFGNNIRATIRAIRG